MSIRNGRLLAWMIRRRAVGLFGTHSWCIRLTEAGARLELHLLVPPACCFEVGP